jgi:hypothetical protein
MVCQILGNLLNTKQVHYVNFIISWWEHVCGIKKKGWKKLLKIQITLICLVYLWWLTFDLVVEKEKVVDNNYNYKLHVFFLLLTTIKLTWQVVGTPKSSSLIKGQHEFHLCTIEFEPKTFWGPNVPKRVIPMNHHPRVKFHFNHSNLNCTVHDFTKRNKRNNWRVHKILFLFIESYKHANLE